MVAQGRLSQDWSFAFSGRSYPPMSNTILMIGAFDTKADEYAFLRKCIQQQECRVLTMNTGVLGACDSFPIDISAEVVAAAGGAELEELRRQRDRGAAIKVLAAGAAELAVQLFRRGRFEGMVGMGGSGGTNVVATAMRALPVGVPKVCLSTVAGGDASAYVGLKDVTLIPSIADVAGLNRITRIMLSRTAGAICGMVKAEQPPGDDHQRVIAASMFGNTTPCVDACRKLLEADGFEVLVFHATGTGGRTMESLIDEGLVDACLDITTTEWADEICGGVFSAGENRLSAAPRQGIPHLIVPGCVDMVNFGPPETVPAHYREAGRTFYEWNPTVTLMRTNVEENRRLGEIFAEKANAARGPVAFLLPLRGVSQLDGDGELFCDREADAALFGSLKHNLNPAIRVEEIDANINDENFAKQAVRMLKTLRDQQPASTPRTR